MTEQLFAFLTSLTHDERAEYFSGKVKAYEITFAFADAGCTVHSQEFQTILATNAKNARDIGKRIATNLNYAQYGWNGHVGAKEIR